MQRVVSLEPMLSAELTACTWCFGRRRRRLTSTDERFVRRDALTPDVHVRL